jgi:hypothetical protein
MGPPTTTEKPDAERNRRKGLAAANLGLNFAVGMVLLSYLGSQLDRRRGGGYGWTLTGLTLGLLYGAYEVWKLARQSNTTDSKQDPP